jgi:hypothetical protein
MDNGYRFIMAFFLIRKRSIILEEWLSKIGGGQLPRIQESTKLPTIEDPNGVFAF